MQILVFAPHLFRIRTKLTARPIAHTWGTPQGEVDETLFGIVGRWGT
jgi:hypothetical protein